MRRKKKNALFSFQSAMLPQRTKTAVRRHARKVSYAPGFGPRDAKEAKLLREIARLGRRERNTVAKKKKSRKRRQPAALAEYWAKRHATKPGVTVRPRKKKNVVRRRRNRRPARRPNLRKHIHLNLTLNSSQKRTLANFLRRATGRRVKVQ